MPTQRFHRSARERRGIATLEFAMSLPILLALLVTIVWLGASLIGQTEVTVQARHKTWKERFNAGQGEGHPLIFKADTLIKNDAETTVDISPLFAGMEPPKANHAVFGGSWDYRQIEMNRPPNWNLYTTVGGQSAGLSVQSLLSELSGLSNFTNEANAVPGLDVFNNLDAIESLLPSQ
jgi:hypothetical protein